VREPQLIALSARLQAALEAAEAWLATTAGPQLEAGARRFALTLGRATAAALLARHAQWSLDELADARPAAAALRFAAAGINMLDDFDPTLARLLADDS